MYTDCGKQRLGMQGIRIRASSAQAVAPISRPS